MSGFRLAALDLDGTLVDSAPDLSHCLGYALGSVGLDSPSLAETRCWIGDGVELLVRRGLESRRGEPAGDKLLAAALEAFEHCYREHLFVHSAVFPGVSETLAGLRSAELTLGCVTNKPEEFARDLLDQAGLARFLQFIYGADSFGTKKPDPTPLIRAAEKFRVGPAHAIMVGDSVNDREAARRAGFGFVFARYGYGEPEEPTLNDGLATIAAFSDLRQLLSL